MCEETGREDDIIVMHMNERLEEKLRHLQWEDVLDWAGERTVRRAEGYLDRAGEGRLLMLAPAGWPYQPGEKKMTRFDACTLNRIAQLVAGEGAAEINYRGMKPGDITSRVAAACKVGLTPNQRDKAHP